MGFVFNAEEIFTFALKIENNGLSFYKKAAAQVTDKKVHNLLNTLAEVEHKHELVFKDLKENYRQKKQIEIYDPEGEWELYLHSMAGGYIFDLSVNPEDVIKPGSTVKDILLYALGREKDSIVFYLGMKELVTDEDDREAINKIIDEEMRHVSFISRELKRIEG